jgi:hypothetical protein
MYFFLNFPDFLNLKEAAHVQQDWGCNLTSGMKRNEQVCLKRPTHALYLKLHFKTTLVFLNTCDSNMHGEGIKKMNKWCAKDRHKVEILYPMMHYYIWIWKQHGWEADQEIDDMMKWGSPVGGKGWKETVCNKEEWNKFLRTARNRRILHMPREWMNEWCITKMYQDVLFWQTIIKLRDTSENVILFTPVRKVLSTLCLFSRNP